MCRSDAWRGGGAFPCCPTPSELLVRVVAFQRSPGSDGQPGDLRVAPRQPSSNDVHDRFDTSAAKTTRTVLSGMIGLAVRHDTLDRNPVRDVGRIEGDASSARALDVASCPPRHWAASATRRTPRRIFGDLRSGRLRVSHLARLPQDRDYGDERGRAHRAGSGPAQARQGLDDPGQLLRPQGGTDGRGGVGDGLEPVTLRVEICR